MYKAILLLSLFIFSSFSFSDHHELSLEARQPTSELEITSITLGEGSSVINVEGKMGEYGRVYVTFTLAIPDGTYTTQGIGYVDEETVFTGSGVGVWHYAGGNIIMYQLVNMSDGAINFDRTIINPLNRTASMDVYILK
jgi:hypothetical protein